MSQAENEEVFTIVVPKEPVTDENGITIYERAAEELVKQGIPFPKLTIIPVGKIGISITIPAKGKNYPTLEDEVYKLAGGKDEFYDLFKTSPIKKPQIEPQTAENSKKGLIGRIANRSQSPKDK